MSIRIYGASDDLIEIEGDIHEELMIPGPYNETLVAVSTGDMIRFRLEVEGWIATPVFNVSNLRLGGFDNGDMYVDIDAAVGWVVLAKEWAG